jgi:hypothetical protein
MHLIKFLKIENNIMAPNVCTRRTMIGRIGPTPDPIACRHFLHLTLAIKLPPPPPHNTPPAPSTPPSRNSRRQPLYSSLSQQPMQPLSHFHQQHLPPSSLLNGASYTLPPPLCYPSPSPSGCPSLGVGSISEERGATAMVVEDAGRRIW